MLDSYKTIQCVAVAPCCFAMIDKKYLIISGVCGKDEVAQFIMNAACPPTTEKFRVKCEV